ncbi:MAG: hypothetical protein Kow00121_42910 [Elainellaceae cyanobacterium]
MAVKRLSAKRQREYKQKVMVLLSGLFFLSMAGFNFVNLFTNSQIETAPVVAENPFQQEEQGYELVLQKEPENQAALEGLTNIRIEMNDLKGAIEPLEKLVQLYPERSDYKTLLDQIKLQATTSSTTP